MASQKHEYTSCAIPDGCLRQSEELVPPAQMEGGCIHRRKQQRGENIREITDKLAGLSQTMREWLAVLGEGQFTSIWKKTVPQDDLKRIINVGWTYHQPDPSAGSRVDLIPRITRLLRCLR